MVDLRVNAWSGAIVQSWPEPSNRIARLKGDWADRTTGDSAPAISKDRVKALDFCAEKMTSEPVSRFHLPLNIPSFEIV